MPKSRLSAAVSLLLVFLSGALLGALAYRAYTIKEVAAAPSRPPRMGPAEWRKAYLNDLRTRVKMDDAQIAKTEQILDQTADEFKQFSQAMQAAQAHQVERINSILRPDQRDLYRAFQEEREKERMRRRPRMEDKK
jgi:hypothetical protein